MSPNTTPRAPSIIAGRRALDACDASVSRAVTAVTMGRWVVPSGQDAVQPTRSAQWRVSAARPRGGLPVQVSLSGLQVFLEEGDRARPGELRCGLVVARGGVVVEAVVHVGIDEGLVPHIVRLQRGLVRGPARIDPLVES